MYAQARLDPKDTLYLEAHGTGTKAGDQAEFESTKTIFCGEGRQQPLLMGSVKSAIGHLESTSGLAALIKTVLMFEKGLVPPMSNLKTTKDGLDYNGSGVIVRNLFNCKSQMLRTVLDT